MALMYGKYQYFKAPDSKRLILISKQKSNNSYIKYSLPSILRTLVLCTFNFMEISITEV